KIIRVAGMERYLLALLPGLRACGLDARLTILVEPGKPMDAYITEMHSLGVPAEQMIIARDLDFKLIGRLAEKLQEFDAVHTHLIHADVHGILAAKRAGLHRVFSTAHNDDPFRRYLPIRLVQGWLWRQVQGGIAISEALRQFLIKVEFAPPERIHTVHYGLDPASIQSDPDARTKLRAELGLKPDALVVGSVCRLTAQKGLTYAIQASKQHPEVNYVIFG